VCFSACSATPDCSPPIAAGTTFKVTVMSEPQQNCHVVKIPQISPFQISAAKTEPTALHPDCAVTPAAAPPSQNDVIIKSCIPGNSDMLSISCEVQYPATCSGTMTFSFTAPKDRIVDWNAPVIEGVTFQVVDHAPNCLDNLNNCWDKYVVRLDRVY
jgi:hypothetical protein